MRGDGDRGEARTRFVVLTAAAIGALLFLLPLHANAAQGDCCQPVSTGPSPVVTDCLVMLGVVVGSQTCTPACACAPKGTLPTSATDALLCLQVVTGQDPPLNCPCSSGTSITRTTVTSTPRRPARAAARAVATTSRPSCTAAACAPARRYRAFSRYLRKSPSVPSNMIVSASNVVP